MHTSDRDIPATPTIPSWVVALVVSVTLMTGLLVGVLNALEVNQGLGLGVGFWLMWTFGYPIYQHRCRTRGLTTRSFPAWTAWGVAMGALIFLLYPFVDRFTNWMF